MDEREKRMQATPEYKKAMKNKNSDSAVYKANKRTFQAMGGFFQEVGRRKKERGFKTKVYDDPDVLFQECDSFLYYCMTNELIPSISLLSQWLDVDQSTLYALISLNDERSEILQKTKIAIYTILEQFTGSGEGNPGGRVFLMKALWGLSDQPNSIDVNVNINGSGAQSTFSPDKIEEIIDLTPDDYSE